MSQDSVTGKLVGMLAHDFRTPLSSVLLHLELLEGAEGLGEEDREDLSYALASARALQEMVAVAVDTIRLAEGGVQPEISHHTVGELCREAARHLATAGAEVTLDIRGPESLTVCCDRSLATRAIRQLVASAQALPPSKNGLRVTIDERDGCARIGVVDGGTTVPEPLRDRLFDQVGAVEIRSEHRQFSRGIGPVFCRLAAEALGGSAGASPAPGAEIGRGNLFWIDLPLVRAVASS